jgi:hypothetical protein
MGGACGTNRGSREIHKEICREDLKEIDYLEGLHVNGRIILEWILEQ